MLFKCYATGSTGNCYVLTDGDEELLLECGLAKKDLLRRNNWNIMNIVGCCVTHGHKDHSKLVNELELMGIKVMKPYLSELPYESNVMGHFVPMAIALLNQNREWLHTDADGSGCPIYAYLIIYKTRRILYCTDYRAMPYTFRKNRLDTIITSCNYEDDAEYDIEAKEYHVRMGHTSLSTVKEMLKANQTDALKNVILCHLSSSADFNRIQREVQEVVGNNVTVNIAVTGNVIEL